MVPFKGLCAATVIAGLLINAPRDRLVGVRRRFCMRGASKLIRAFSGLRGDPSALSSSLASDSSSTSTFVSCDGNQLRSVGCSSSSSESLFPSSCLEIFTDSFLDRMRSAIA